MSVCCKEVRDEQTTLLLNLEMLGFCWLSCFSVWWQGSRQEEKVVLKTGVLERQVTYFSLFPKCLKELCSSSTTLFYMYTWEEY